MDELIFYKFNILAGIAMALCLSVISPSLAARRQSPFIFSFSQISINVLLLSVVLGLSDNKILTAILGSFLCLIMQKFSKKVAAESEVIVHTSLFVGLYSINQFLVSHFPQLQAYSSLHHTGDLVTILNSDAITLSVFCLLSYLGLVYCRKKLLYLDFTTSIGLTLPATQFFHKFGSSIALLFFYFILSLSNLYFGFLFTVGHFFILSLLSVFTFRNWTRYHIGVLIYLATTVPISFYISVKADTVTVPILLLVYLASFAVERVFSLGVKPQLLD